MEINQEKTVFQLAFMPKIFPVNCYLIEEENSLTLIDAALPNSVLKIEETIKKMGKPLTKIVLTHAHGDHIGALDRLKENHPDVTVYISKRDARLLNGDTTLDPQEPQTPIRGGVPKNIKTKPDILLQDGDLVGSLKAIETPGHTPGSMSFFDTRNNILIVGDAFQVRGGVAVTGQFKPLFPFPALATWNKPLALSSAKKLLKCNPETLAVGHGKLLKSPLALMEKAIRNFVRSSLK